MPEETSMVMSLSASAQAHSGGTWVARLGGDGTQTSLASEWRSYVASRDPHRSAGIEDFRDQVLSMVGLFRHLPLEELRSAVRQVFLAALEAYARDDMAPLEDMAGGWLATAEVESNPRLVTALDEAMHDIEVMASQWTPPATPRRSTITYTIRRAGYGNTVEVRLPM